jgi:hypothetical protein
MRLATLLALVLGALFAPAATASAASLRMVDASPLRLAGAGFSPRERVRVVVRLGETRRVRHVRAGARGRVRVSFRHLAAVDACGPGLTATATGSAGHRATLKLPPRMCPVEQGGGDVLPPPPPQDPCTVGERFCPVAP